RSTPEDEASLWQLRNKETSFAIFPSAVDVQLIINDKPLFIPKGTMLGKWDFMPHGKYIFDPGDRSYALAEFFDGWEAFFRCTDRAKERNMIEIRPPAYIMGDTKEERMANFTKRVGFSIISFDGLGYTVIGETNTVREKFAALRTRSVNGRTIEESLM